VKVSGLSKIEMSGTGRAMTLALLTMSHGEINRAEWMLRIHERRATQAQVIFPRRRGQSDCAAIAATCDVNSNSIGLT
jgi:hypothetical protein